MDAPEHAIATLQRFIDDYPLDVAEVHAAFADPSEPLPSRRLLAGALNYVLDAFDMFPDHYPALGIADDAIVLRLAAAQALVAGSCARSLERLAFDAPEIKRIFPSLAEPLDRFVGALPEAAVNGRTADRILGDADTQVLFSADVLRETRRKRSVAIPPGVGGAAGILNEFERMMRHALKRGGFT